MIFGARGRRASLVASIGLSLWLAGPMPNAETLLEGLDAPATIVFDRNGVATIFAQTEHDALFLQGYLHARDRLFQMDFQRRAFAGTLAEMFGLGPDENGDGVPDVLAQDIQLRTLGLRRAAEASAPVQTPEVNAWLSAYAEGVNAFLRDETMPLPPEYGALELTRAGIPPWTELDSLTVAKGLAFQLSFDLEDIDRTLAFLNFDGVSTFCSANPQFCTQTFVGSSLFFGDLYRTAPFDRTIAIPPDEPAAAAPDDKDAQDPEELPPYFDGTTEGLLQGYRDTVAEIPLLQSALETPDSGQGSNWFLAAGAITESGYAMIANDPHLSLGTPSTFYEVHLNVQNALNVTGTSFPGAPGVVLGCNDTGCWGAAVNALDVTDVYQERLFAVPTPGVPPGTPTHTVFEGALEPMLIIPQAFFFNVIGDGQPDNLANAGVGPTQGGVTFVVPRRNFGPIVNIDTSDPSAITALSVAYVGWGPTQELEAFRRFAVGSSVDDFREGLQYFDFGSQNFSYANTNGDIAYFTSGELPIREDFQLLLRPDGLISPLLIRDGTHTLKHEWLAVTNPQPQQILNREILPFDEMPQIVNPSRGYVVQGNNDPIGTSLDNISFNQLRTSGSGLLYLSPGYATGFRAGRIQRLFDEALAGGGKLSMEQFRAFQANNQLLDAEVLTPFLLEAYANATAGGAVPMLADLGADPRIAEAISRLAAWDFSTPTGIPEGYDPGDDPWALPMPGQAEIDASVAATIYSAWRGQVIRRVIDGTLASISPLFELDEFAPGSSLAMSAFRNLLDGYPDQPPCGPSDRCGVGFSGLNFFVVPGVSDRFAARDIILLESLRDALDLLASDQFAPAFGNSTDQSDYRWGKLHRVVFDHPLGSIFSIPPNPFTGLTDLAPGLPGLSRAGGFGAVDASAHDARAASLNAFMFGSGAARRKVASLTPSGPQAIEVIPGGTSGVLGSPFQADQLRLWLVNEYHPLPVAEGDVLALAVRDEMFKGCNEADPLGQGYWHRQCLGVPASDGGIDPGREGRGPQSPTEPDFWDPDSGFGATYVCADARLNADIVFGLNDVCEGMDAEPANDSCEKAEKQLTSMILNVCSQRLGDLCEIDASAYGCGATTVGGLIDEIAGYINGGDPAMCQVAASCADAVNSGDALGAVSPAPASSGVESWPGKLGGEEPRGGATAPRSIGADPQQLQPSEGRDRLRAPKRGDATRQDVLLQNLANEPEPRAKLGLVRKLVGTRDPGLVPVLIGHLVVLRDEARETGQDDVAKKAERLLRRLEPEEE